MTGIRDGSAEARGELIDLINEWMLSFCADGSPPFPSSKTPLATVILLNDIATYYAEHPEQAKGDKESATINALFRRISIEYKLRQIDSPTQAQGLIYD